MAVLGLMVLAFGLLVAPLTHALKHDHRHTHGAPPAQSGPHGEGAVEHLLALATQAPAVPVLLRERFLVTLVQAQRPRAPQVASWNRVEESQGP